MSRPAVNIRDLIADLKFPNRLPVNVLNDIERELTEIALVETSIIIDGVEFKRTTPPSHPEYTD